MKKQDWGKNVSVLFFHDSIKPAPRTSVEAKILKKSEQIQIKQDINTKTGDKDKPPCPELGLGIIFRSQ